VIVVGAGLGWIVRQAHVQRGAVAAIEESGGAVRYDWEFDNLKSLPGGKSVSHLICRSEPKRLRGHQDYPSVPLLAPTHRTAPANRRDRIVVKNLVAEGLDRLHGEFKKREVAPVVQNLNNERERWGAFSRRS
jgi:hypothetical protein